MEWQKPSPELSALLADAVAAFPCERRKMFGCPACFVNGQMFAGVYGGSLFVRLSLPDREALLSGAAGAAPFAPQGRTMREYVVLPEGLLRDGTSLRLWLERSYAYAGSLPAKESKKTGKRSS